MLTKTCTRCGLTKEVTDFYKQKNGPLGRMTQCIMCRKEVAAEVMAADPGASRARHKRYAEKHKESRREKRHALRETQREKVLAYEAEYRAIHREEEAQRQARYREKNRALMRERSKLAYHADLPRSRLLARLRSRTISPVVRHASDVREKWRTGNSGLKVWKALRDGVLFRGPCEQAHIGECDGIMHAHHDDYDFPLTVRWLCQHHHAQWHETNTPHYYKGRKP